jgi:hypothetical protein
MAISLRRQRNKPLETPVNIWARSKGRIKSYVPLEWKLLRGPWFCLTRHKGVLSSNISATSRKTASVNSCKQFNKIQWSDQELRTCWAGTLVWLDETPPAFYGDFIVTPMKQASWNSCKYLSTIQRLNQELRTFEWKLLCGPWSGPTRRWGCQVAILMRRQGNIVFENSKNLSTILRSNQELWTIWAGSLIWPEETPPMSHGDFTAMPMKQASWNSCKYLSTIQQSDQELWTSRACTLVWSLVMPDQTLSMSRSNFSATPRKTACRNLG